MKRLICILLAGLLLGLCAACTPAQPDPEDQTQEAEKTFFEKRYTTLSYDEYFSQMRPVKNMLNTDFNEFDGKKDTKNTSNDEESREYTLYITPISSIGSDQIEVLQNIKETYPVSPREGIYVTTDNKIYCVDEYTGEKYLIYESPVPVSNLDASVDLISYTSGNTLYRIFRPTGQVDEFSVPVEEGKTINSPYLRGNMLLAHGTENPEYNKYVALNGGNASSPIICWDTLIADFGEDTISQLKQTAEETGRTLTIGEFLDSMFIPEYLVAIYDLQSGQTYTYNGYHPPCPCPNTEICQSYEYL